MVYQNTSNLARVLLSPALLHMTIRLPPQAPPIGTLSRPATPPDAVVQFIRFGYRAILAPTGVSASDGTYTDKVQVSWNASSGATYYEVYRNTPTPAATSPLGSPSASPYDDMSGTAGTTYWYFIKACNTAGCSGFSSSDSGYRNQGPLTPSNFRMINTTQTSITIGWIMSAMKMVIKSINGHSQITSGFLLSNFSRH